MGATGCPELDIRSSRNQGLGFRVCPPPWGCVENPVCSSEKAGVGIFLGFQAWVFQPVGPCSEDLGVRIILFQQCRWAPLFVAHKPFRKKKKKGFCVLCSRFEVQSQLQPKILIVLIQAPATRAIKNFNHHNVSFSLNS